MNNSHLVGSQLSIAPPSPPPPCILLASTDPPPALLENNVISPSEIKIFQPPPRPLKNHYSRNKHEVSGNSLYSLSTME